MAFRLDFGTARARTATAAAPAMDPGQAPLPYGDPTGGPDAAGWLAAADGPKPYPRVAIDRSYSITMSDGVVLRATVVRPANRMGRPVGTAFPAVLNINPYNRMIVDGFDHVLHGPGIGRALRSAGHAVNGSGTPLEGLTRVARGATNGVFDVFGINRNLVRNGYAQVIVDVRGTGSSHGKWQILGEREQLDSVEVVDWIARQPWCTGAVGMAGWSYSAINSLQTAGHRPAGLQAVFAVEGCSDIVRDIYITGGMPSAFIPIWLSAVNALKWVPNPATALIDTLRGDLGRWLLDRVKSPITEMPSLMWGFLTARDDRIFDDPYFDERAPRIDRIEVPTFTVGGWHDLFGRSATEVYNDLPLEPGRKQTLIADGYHIDPGFDHGSTATPPRLDVLEIAWFDRWLKGIDNGIDRYGPVTMQQQGGSWTTGASFPRPGMRPHRMYLQATGSGTAKHARHDGSLAAEPGNHEVTLPVQPDLRGLVSRDMTQVTAGATMLLGRHFTTDARFQERGGLTFTSDPVTERTQISGKMNLRLNVSTSGHEGIWAVTVNDVAPDGTSTVLSNGALTASNRALDPAKSTYTECGKLIDAHHYLTRERRLPVPADEPVRIDVDLVPTDAVLEPGHRLRVDVYAASLPRYLTVVPDLIRARGRRQRLILDPHKPSHLTFLSDGAWTDAGEDRVSGASTPIAPVQQIGVR